jgi:lipopolysaccharide/colanic/teichoic acid biosynthesis glycosyltransferase
VTTAGERTEGQRLTSTRSRMPAFARVCDCVVVLLLLPFVLPVAVVIAVAVFVDSPGPVLYRSRRIGRDGRPFWMLKFRTMAHESEGPPISARDDERYTPFGRTLAYSRLDELPQLVNVLRGEMRVVGPRPEIEDFVLDFPEQYDRILKVPPGLTGPAQLEYAWEGETLAQALAVDRARLYRESIMPLKIQIDMRYADAHSAGGDLVILLRTLMLPAVRFWRLCAAVLAGDEPVGARRLVAVLTALAAVIALVALLMTEGSAPV